MLGQLISDLKEAMNLKSTNIAPTDTLKHAQKFSKAVDDYVKKLKDPAKRPPMVTVSALMIPLIIPVTLSPGTGVTGVDALKAATQYAIAISTYAAAIVISPSPVMLPLGGIVVPPGKVMVSKLIDLGIMLSIQNDFKSIFEESIEGPEEVVLLVKASKMADAIKKAFTTKTNIIISGLDSMGPPPIPPIPFSITGPFS
jgi:hypothetical protein